MSYLRPVGDDAAPAAAVGGTTLIMVAGLAALVLWPEKRRGRKGRR